MWFKMSFTNDSDFRKGDIQYLTTSVCLHKISKKKDYTKNVQLILTKPASARQAVMTKNSSTTTASKPCLTQPKQTTTVPKIAATKKQKSKHALKQASAKTHHMYKCCYGK